MLIKKIFSKIHVNIPFIVSSITLILVLDIIMRVGIWSPIFWALIITIIFLEVYFTSIIKMILSSRSQYPFIRFVGHLSAFSFLTIFLFALMFSNLSDTGNYLWSIVEGQRVGGFDNAFYFSGVTMLSIGYGDIIPYGFFRVLSLIEGFIGSFIILSFFSLGVSQIFIQVKTELKKDEKQESEIQQELEGIREDLDKKVIKRSVNKTSKIAAKTGSKTNAKTSTKTKK